jgi:hypothetical protein
MRPSQYSGRLGPVGLAQHLLRPKKHGLTHRALDLVDLVIVSGLSNITVSIHSSTVGTNTEFLTQWQF